MKIIREKSSPKQKKIKQTFLKLKQFRFENRKCLLQQNMVLFQYTHRVQFLTVSFRVVQALPPKNQNNDYSCKTHVIKNFTCGMRVHSHMPTFYSSSTVACFDFSEYFLWQQVFVSRFLNIHELH